MGVFLVHRIERRSVRDSEPNPIRTIVPISLGHLHSIELIEGSLQDAFQGSETVCASSRNDTKGDPYGHVARWDLVDMKEAMGAA